MKDIGYRYDFDGKIREVEFKWSSDKPDNRVVAGGGLIAQHKSYLIQWALFQEQRNLDTELSWLKETQKRVDTIQARIDQLKAFDK